MQDKDPEGRAGMHDTSPDGRGRNPRTNGTGAPARTARKKHSCSESSLLMEAVVGRENMVAALKRVAANKGAPGVDNMPVENLRPYLREHWPRIKEELLEGRYKPKPVRKVMIPKPGGRVIIK